MSFWRWWFLCPASRKCINITQLYPCCISKLLMERRSDSVHNIILKLGKTCLLGLSIKANTYLPLFSGRSCASFIFISLSFLNFYLNVIFVVLCCFWNPVCNRCLLFNSNNIYVCHQQKRKYELNSSDNTDRLITREWLCCLFNSRINPFFCLWSSLSTHLCLWGTVRCVTNCSKRSAHMLR